MADHKRIPDDPSGDDEATADLEVRPMAAEEYSTMRAVSVAAFGDDQSIGTLIDTLRESWVWHDQLCFVALRNGEIVAQVLYTSATLDAPDRLVGVLVLSPVGVRPDLQGRGIGSAMIRRTLDLLQDRPEPLVFLEGSPRYYPRFGFRPGGELQFRKPSLRIPDPAFMALPLPRYEPWMTGTLVYPDAFWRTDSVGLR